MFVISACKVSVRREEDKAKKHFFAIVEGQCN